MITLKKDEKRVITVLMDNSSVVLEGVKRPIGSGRKDSIASLQNDRVSGLQNDRVEVVLAGENSSVEVVGLVLPARSYFGTSGSIRTRAKERSLADKGKVDDRSLEIYITHAAPNTKSNVNVRAVLRGKSTFAFKGNVKIEKGAKGADAYLRSDALLFDDAKMGDDTPALEILEPDVKAGHAATIGKVDEEMIFYLMSRGLSRDSAEKLIIQGFIGPMREKIMEQTPLRSPKESYEGQEE
ncbi:MAG: SufD family Fe-S cluster assembly protein [Candidatus Curtissbacteria bacterium]|nr:SufD family Fe-S cluster assembly protein [Candidatus Curtissbacteria bacterium]